MANTQIKIYTNISIVSHIKKGQNLFATLSGKKGQAAGDTSRDAFEKDSHRHVNPVLNTKTKAYCDLLISNLLTEMKNSSLL